MKSVWSSLMVAVSFYSIVVTVMILVASPHETAATIFQPNQTTANLTVLARVSYPSSDSSPRCDYLHQPCAPLNDCWGTTLQSKQYAFVGLSNGIDFLDVTDPERPRKTADDAFIAGCITEWRDIKSYKEAVYVVNDDTAYCSCAQQPCQFQLNLTGLPEPSAPVPAVLAKFGLQLSASSATIEGRVVWPASADLSYGCTNDTWTGNPLAVAPWIALVDRGVCGMAEKVRQAQSAGAAGVIIISYRDDSIPPSMNGNSTGINVPAALIAHSHGQVIRSQLDAGVVVTAQFSGNNFVYNPEFQAPEGLWVINFSNPAKPVLVNKHTEWFGSAHNILIDPNPSRPYLYACGMNTANGGLMVFDVSSPLQPRLIGTWNTAYFHDVEVAFRHDLGKYVLFGTAIYNGQVYMLNVNSPRDGDWLNTITVWTTPDWPHNTASTPDGKTLYVSHEDFAMSISIWSVENLNAITTVGEINIQADQRTIPHNVYIRGQHLWASYYVSGVVVFDIKDPHNPVLLAGSNAMVDPTYPAGSGYHGVWGIYPLPKGSITYASDIETGFYTLELELPAPPPADSGISGVGVFVVILVIILVGVGLFFVWRYIKNKKIDFSVASFHSPFDSSSKKGDRLALDDDEDEDPLFKEEII